MLLRSARVIRATCLLEHAVHFATQETRGLSQRHPSGLQLGNGLTA